jgi:hypothetical protein
MTKGPHPDRRDALPARFPTVTREAGSSTRRHRDHGGGSRRGRERGTIVVVAVVGVLVAAVVLGVGAWLWSRLDDDTRAISIDQAVEDFQSGDTTVDADAAGSEPSATELPTPGVYPYETSGGESLALLNKPSRTYQPQTALVVQAGGCGVVVSWTPLEERAESWEMCRRDGGIAVSRSESVHEFFDQREVRTFTCAEGAWLVPPSLEVGETWQVDCVGDGISENRAAELVEVAGREVGGSSVEAVHVRMTVTTSGSTIGTTIRDLWLDRRTGLPLEWSDTVENVSDSPLGDARYTEDIHLVATRTTPAS